MTWLCVSHDLVVCITWPVCVYHMTWLCVSHNLVVCITWPGCVYHMTCLCVSHDLVVCITWPGCEYHVIQWTIQWTKHYVARDSNGTEQSFDSYSVYFLFEFVIGFCLLTPRTCWFFWNVLLTLVTNSWMDVVVGSCLFVTKETRCVTCPVMIRIAVDSSLFVWYLDALAGAFTSR